MGHSLPAAAITRPFLLGGRGLTLLAIAAAALWAVLALGLAPADLAPSEPGLHLAGRFFAHALSPDLSAPVLRETLAAAWRTVLYAAAAMSLSLVVGVVLGFLASTSWWAGDPAGGESRRARWLRRSVLPVLYGALRVLIAFLRSVHELLWAVLLNAALGLDPLVAVVAIAIPYAGTLAKVFSEMADEAPRDTADALRASGAAPLAVFAFGLLPRALPDMAAYAFYRFECALRSAAILGFFGYLTLGYYIEDAFHEGHYGALWTYLYATFLLVIVVDVWSGRLRRGIVA